MTPIQRQAVRRHQGDGFLIVEENRDIVRLSKGSNAILVRPDGTTMRANHFIGKGKRT